MPLRRIGVAVLLVLATLALTATSIAIWANRQALNTDNWVTTSGRLLEDKAIQDALGGYLVTQLFTNAPVQDKLEQVLPPRLAPLAGPAAAGLRVVAERNAPQLLGSSAAQSAWSNANRTAHESLLKLLDGETLPNGEVSLDLHTLVSQLAGQVGLPASTAEKLPPHIANLVIFNSDQLQSAQDGLKKFRRAPIILGILSILLLAGAVALSEDRRGTLRSCGICLIFAGVAVFAIRRLGQHVVVSQLADAPDAQQAATDAWRIATSLLVDVAEGSIAFGVLVLLEVWLAGPGRRATELRRLATPAFRDHAGYTHATLGALLLLLVIWGPVPWTRNFWPMLVVAVITFAWLEWLRRRTVRELQPPTPNVPDPAV